MYFNEKEEIKERKKKKYIYNLRNLEIMNYKFKLIIKIVTNPKSKQKRIRSVKYKKY